MLLGGVAPRCGAVAPRGAGGASQMGGCGGVLPAEPHTLAGAPQDLRSEADSLGASSWGAGARGSAPASGGGGGGAAATAVAADAIATAAAAAAAAALSVRLEGVAPIGPAPAGTVRDACFGSATQCASIESARGSQTAALGSTARRALGPGEENTPSDRQASERILSGVEMGSGRQGGPSCRRLVVEDRPSALAAGSAAGRRASAIHCFHSSCRPSRACVMSTATSMSSLSKTPL